MYNSGSQPAVCVPSEVCAKLTEGYMKKNIVQWKEKVCMPPMKDRSSKPDYYHLKIWIKKIILNLKSSVYEQFVHKMLKFPLLFTDIIYSTFCM